MATAQLNVSLKPEIREEMRKNPQVNWSHVCSEAVVKKLDHIHKSNLMKEAIFMQIAKTTKDMTVLEIVFNHGIENLSDDMLELVYEKVCKRQETFDVPNTRRISFHTLKGILK